jgi:hypothetical protein
MFWRALEWKMLVYLLHYKLVYFTSFGEFVAIWSLYVVVIDIFPRF